MELLVSEFNVYGSELEFFSLDDGANHVPGEDSELGYGEVILTIRDEGSLGVTVNDLICFALDKLDLV
jgi:hypothetical protein